VRPAPGALEQLEVAEPRGARLDAHQVVPVVAGQAGGVGQLRAVRAAQPAGQVVERGLQLRQALGAQAAHEAAAQRVVAARLLAALCAAPRALRRKSAHTPTRLTGQVGHAQHLLDRPACRRRRLRR